LAAPLNIFTVPLYLVFLDVVFQSPAIAVM
jgi:hypothetical protein